MNTSTQKWYWKLGLTIFLALSGAIAALGNHALAQINPDTTLGNENSVVSPNVVINDLPSDQINGGAVRGTNLFHSFQEFNVEEGRGAYFTNPAGVENILSRVTGNNPSNFLGKLGVLGDANLFFINPNGIIFGANASLDVRGSFVATTANAIRFGDRGFFSASAPNQPELLTVNPSAFLFNQIAAQSITNQSTTGLQVPSGQSLLLVGGDVRLDSGKLTAAGGRVELGGLASFGIVDLDFDQNNLLLSFPLEVPRANVSLTNGSGVDVTAGGGGSIAVNAQNLDISGGSSLLAGIRAGLGTIGNQAGNIEIDATQQVSISGISFTGSTSIISNLVNTGAIGNAGNVVIETGDLNLSGNAIIASATDGQGNAGNVTIQARDAISFVGSSSSGITSAVRQSGVGNGGDVNIQTRSLSLSDGALLFTATLGQGNAGNFQVNAADSISISGGSLVGTLTDGQGNGGNVTLNAGGTVSFDGVGANNLPSNAASVVEEQAVGDGGNISIQARSLFLTNGAFLLSRTEGQGNAGSVSLRTDDSISLANGIISALVLANAVGQSGNINIQARSLSLTDGSQLNTSTLGQGDAGDIEVNTTDSVSVSNGSQLNTSTLGQGDAGDIEVNTTDSVSVSSGSILQATTLGQGDAGNITITAGDTVSFDGVRKFSLSELEFDNPSGALSLVLFGAVGKGGEINIQAQSLSLTNGAQLGTSTAGQGNAGNIKINATDSVFVNGGSVLQAITYGQGDAGDITITAGDRVSFDGVRTFSPFGTDLVGPSAASSSVGPSPRAAASFLGLTPEVLSNLVELLPATANLAIDNLIQFPVLPGNGKGGDISIQANSFSLTNGATLTSNTLGQGDAGSISVQTDNSILLENGLIGTTVEQSGVGNGGNINLQTGELSLTSTAEVSASSNGAGDAGNLNITAGSIGLDDRGKLTAQTASGDGGDINLQLQDLLLLRRNSQISTTAGTAQAGGNGGNITIDAPLLVAIPREDSNITANAFAGRGGNVRITAEGIFGIQFREQETPLSDITASSNFGVDGTVEIITPDIDPSQGLVALPVVPVDTQVSQACTPGGSQQQSEFVVTGRGGLPPNPTEALSSDAIQINWVTLNPEIDDKFRPDVSTNPTAPELDAIVEAQGWVIGKNGEVVLTASAPTATPYGSWQTPSNCHRP